MMEIDFKYFYALIYDHEHLRVVFILSERSSENLRERVKELSDKIIAELENLLEDFTGELGKFEKIIPQVILQSINLYYKDLFRLADNLRIEKAIHLTSMEKRLINVLRSNSRNGEDFLLKSILKMTSEKNEDLIIEAIEGLIQKKLIIPSKMSTGIIKTKKFK
jgi:hypothetical protein